MIQEHWDKGSYCAACSEDDRYPHTCTGTAVDTVQGLPVPEYTGGSSSYYSLEVKNTTSGGPAYMAECNDIIEALGMNFAEGNAFKALWRRAAQRTLGKVKKGADADGLYDAEKVEFFGKRLVEQSKAVRNA